MHLISLLQSFTPNHEKWSNFMGYENVYLDPYKYHITANAKVNDQDAYDSFRNIDIFMISYGFKNPKYKVWKTRRFN